MKSKELLVSKSRPLFTLCMIQTKKYLKIVFPIV